MTTSNFEKELEQLINKHSIENESNTPDFILARYLMNCLQTLNILTERREDWYGRKPKEMEGVGLKDVKECSRNKSEECGQVNEPKGKVYGNISPVSFLSNTPIPNDEPTGKSPKEHLGNTKSKVQWSSKELTEAYNQGVNAFSPSHLFANGADPGYEATADGEWILMWKYGYEIAKNKYLLDEANIQIKQLKKDRDYYGERAETNAEKLKVFAECSKEEINKLETKLFKLKGHLNMSLKDKLNPVIQEWVQQLSFMQQSVLITAIRGPDGLPKEHVSKKLIKWLRRCVLYSAFDSKLHNKPFILDNPYNPSGGGFTGPSLPEECVEWQEPMFDILKKYLQETDSMPHHFQMHIMHASEIIGYCHQNKEIKEWWNKAYVTIVKTMHLFPESYEMMTKRLGDSESSWRAMDTANSNFKEME